MKSYVRKDETSNNFRVGVDLENGTEVSLPTMTLDEVKELNYTLNQFLRNR